MITRSNLRSSLALGFIAGLLLTGTLSAQTGNWQNLSNINLAAGSQPVTTVAVSASGNGIVKFVIGKPLASPNGACVRVNAQILRNNSPAATQMLIICNSSSREIQTSHSGSAQYALRLTRVDPWNTVPVNFTEMKVFYPTSNTPISLSIPGTLMNLAAGNVQFRDFNVPGPGALMVRVKWSPSVQVQAYLQRGTQTIATQTGSQGTLTINANVTAGGTYRISVRNANTRTSTQLSIDRVEFTPAN